MSPLSGYSPLFTWGLLHDRRVDQLAGSFLCLERCCCDSRSSSSPAPRLLPDLKPAPTAHLPPAPGASSSSSTSSSLHSSPKTAATTTTTYATCSEPPTTPEPTPVAAAVVLRSHLSFSHSTSSSHDRLPRPPYHPHCHRRTSTAPSSGPPSLPPSHSRARSWASRRVGVGSGASAGAGAGIEIGPEPELEDGTTLLFPSAGVCFSRSHAHARPRPRTHADDDDDDDDDDTADLHTEERLARRPSPLPSPLLPLASLASVTAVLPAPSSPRSSFSRSMGIVSPANRRRGRMDALACLEGRGSMRSRGKRRERRDFISMTDNDDEDEQSVGAEVEIGRARRWRRRGGTNGRRRTGAMKPCVGSEDVGVLGDDEDEGDGDENAPLALAAATTTPTPAAAKPMTTRSLPTSTFLPASGSWLALRSFIDLRTDADERASWPWRSFIEIGAA